MRNFCEFFLCIFVLLFIKKKFGEGGDCGSVGYIFMCTFLFCFFKMFFIDRRLF